MPSDPGRRYADRLTVEAEPLLRHGEVCVAALPFTSVPRVARHGGPKVKTGIRQTARRYRPLVVTSERLLVFDAGRTPGPRGLLATYELDRITLVDVGPLRFGGTRFVLALGGDGVPFDAGRHDLSALGILIDGLGGDGSDAVQRSRSTG